MGHGIAQVAAMAGYEVRLFDVQAEALSSAIERIRRNLDQGVQRGKVAGEVRDTALTHLATVSEMAEAVSGAAVVIEAVPEKLELKRRVLEDVSRHAPPEALLATNTSSLSVTAIAAGLPEPSRVVGMHFFNPVHIMQLVEVVRGAKTSDETVEKARALVGTLQKTPIVVRDSPGFASSRLGLALGLEAIRMVEEGVASPQDIDAAMTLGYRHPMGPLRLTDLVGLDVRLDIARYLHRKLGTDRFAPPTLLERMVEEGKLGKKTGQGFYQWDEE